MTFILSLETSTTVCSVSVSGDGKVLSFREIMDAKSHASQVIPFISEVLSEACLKPQQLDAIAVSKGPGSYTGLRIGVSTAKGIAYALNIPLISVNTLYSMASGFLEQYPAFKKEINLLLCPMIDARRMEVYSAVYNSQLNEIRDIKAEIIHPDSFINLFSENQIHFFGDGAMKCKQMIHNESAFFHEGFHPSAKYMAGIAYERYKVGKTENLAYFEPFYLKDFVTTIPSQKMF